MIAKTPDTQAMCRSDTWGLIEGVGASDADRFLCAVDASDSEREAAIAHRLCTAMNACRGFPTEALEHGALRGLVFFLHLAEAEFARIQSETGRAPDADVTACIAFLRTLLAGVDAAR